MTRIGWSITAVVALSAVALGAVPAGAAGQTVAAPPGGISLPGDSALPKISQAVRVARPLGEEYFRVQWGAAPARAGMERISGYVYNDYGEAAQGVELRITGFDAAGKPVGSTTALIADDVPGRGRTYFDLQVPRRAAYRVGVESFEFVENGSGN